MFNASAFMNAVYQDANATEIKKAPEGTYIGQIQPVTEKSVASGVIDKGDNAGNPWARLDLNIVVEGNNEIKQATGLDRKVFRAGLMLDLTPAGGLDFAPDRNIKLGRVRAATGLNVPGQPFSFQQFGGKTVKFQTKHRVDEKDPTRVYEDVIAFFPPY